MDVNAAAQGAAPDPFTEMVTALRQVLQSVSPPTETGASATNSTPLARPTCYTGEPSGCSGFILQCSLFVNANTCKFPNEATKVAFVISLLTGRALQWAEALWSSKSPVLSSFDAFVTHLQEVFGVALTPLSIHDELLNLRQGAAEIHDYTLRFRTLAATSGWNQIALLAAYRKGLKPQIRKQMVIYDDNVSLETFIRKTINVAQHLSACASTASYAISPSARTPSPQRDQEEPMITDSYRLEASERRRRIQERLCLYCGEATHLIHACPVRPPRPMVSTVSFTPSVSHIPHIKAQITINSRNLSIHVLVDSGAASNFISSHFVTKHRIPIIQNETTYRITTIQGSPLGGGKITRRTHELQLVLPHGHREQLALLVLPRATVDVVLGRPWLAQHNPQINWSTGEIQAWDPECQSHIHRSPVQSSQSAPPHLQLHSTSIGRPALYSSYSDVFSKEQATRLPPHRPWDCSIDLLPGAKLPHGKIYPLSRPEQVAMEEYIQEALDQGFIRPSTSPAASSFFFVPKKDGGLRPCIDYRVLNDATVKFAYPLPLVPAALEELREAKVFTKLDLRSAYNLIRIREGDEWKTAFITPAGHYEYQVMPYGLANSPSIFQSFMNEIFRDYLHQFVIVYIDDILIYSRNIEEHQTHVCHVLQRLRDHHLYLKAEKCEFHCTTVSFLGYVISAEGVHMESAKVDAVANWAEPTTVKELQRFLGFANFYRRFIKNYSLHSAPLTSLLKGGQRQLRWTSQAREAFGHLKHLFTSAPILRHPDPSKPFVVEVDAANHGIGAVLSQWSGEPCSLHPCAYFSRKLSPAECNYGIGDRELLAIKLALEEWRHWLEGAQFPFTVVTDHKNLQYLQNAKRLNARQARWSLFFARFNFQITYQPGHKNTKADALSRMYSPEPDTNEPDSILPPSVFLAPILWQIDEEIRAATLEEPAPPEVPTGLIYVPTSQRLPLLESAHTSPGSGHPGSRRTLSLIQQKYWWPNMVRDVTRYILGCSVCAVTTTPRQLPVGKLQPLPIPRRPWTHLGVDFATDLPPSRGYTTILVVVDRFSKSCKLIPLKGLPTAFETAEALFTNVFRNYGTPEDIVSDRGPQFISRVWRAFFQLLGTSVSLSSGYHPQTNGQTERKIQEISRYLRTYCSQHQDTWSQYLPWAEYAQNSLRQTTTGLTPFQCVLGYQPPLFPWSGEVSEVPAVDHWFQESERVWDSAHIHLQRAVRRHTETANRRRSPNPVYLPGDKVWLSTRDIRLRLPCKKLSPRYIGPFPIHSQINPVTYRLDLPPRYRISPTFHVSLLKRHTDPVSPSSTEPEPPPPPDQPEILGDSIYQVQEILDSRRRNGHLEYLIDWEGFGPEERSWVPRNDILDPALLDEFHRQHPDRPAPRGRGRPRRRSRVPGVTRGGGGSVTPSARSLSPSHHCQSPSTQSPMHRPREPSPEY
uniref:Gypsy retrotransposon integrase-like protein 1 n=1 Tax=Cyprinus carpio TaxID=7962 RepID=A0A8C2AU46_CYPCA